MGEVVYDVVFLELNSCSILAESLGGVEVNGVVDVLGVDGFVQDYLCVLADIVVALNFVSQVGLQVGLDVVSCVESLKNVIAGVLLLKLFFYVVLLLG